MTLVRQDTNHVAKWPMFELPAQHRDDAIISVVKDA